MTVDERETRLDETTPTETAEVESVSRVAVRVVAAGTITLLLAAAVLRFSSSELEPPIEIVGYPSFESFSYHRNFLSYRLLMWAVPLGTLVGYLLLRRWGPLADKGGKPPTADRRDSWQVLLDAPVRQEEARPDSGTRRSEPSLDLVWRLASLLPTMLLVALAASVSGTPDPSRQITVTGLLTGLGVGLVIVAVAAASSRTLGPTRFTDRLSLVHTFGAALVALGALTWWLRHTAAVHGTEVDRYPVVPWWLAVLVAAAVLGVLAALLARGEPARRLEHGVLLILSGAVLVYLATAGLANSVGPIQGFDDMQSVTGADLMSRGHFPWSDFLFIHGLFEDALRTTAGFALFGHTLWAGFAAIGMLWIPLSWVGLYLFGVWAARGRTPVVLVVGALVLWTAQRMPPSERWVAAAVVFVLLGEAVRRGQTAWTVLLTSVLFVHAVLLPEASFQVIAVAVVLLGSDLVHGPRGLGWWRRLPRTRDFVLTDLVATLLWSVFLLVNGALVDWISYYVIFGPGHADAGALPIGEFATTTWTTVLVLVLALTTFTLCVAGAAVVGRVRLTSRHWVGLGAAVLTGLYGEKAIARFDDGHLLQVITVAMPLVVLWLVAALTFLDGRLSTMVKRAAQSPPAGRRRVETGWRRDPLPTTSPLLSVAVLALVLVVLQPLGGLRDAPGRNVKPVGDPLPRLGYTNPGTVDPDLLTDLEAVLDTYTGSEGGVFDFTNSPGYFYYLLGADPTTRYYHVSMAVPAFAQEQLIEELEEDPPALVVYDGFFGLPGWDGPHNEVRHYVLSQYLHDNYSPALRVRGVLFLLRDDLATDQPDPSTVDLSVTPETTDLHFAAPTCDFGDTANYLTSEPSGETVELPVRGPVPARRLQVAGWAYDVAADRPVEELLLVVGDTVVASFPSTYGRPDVAAAIGEPDAVSSGFSGGVTSPRRGRVGVYAVLADGRAHPVGTDVPDVPERLNRPGGPVPVDAEPAPGAVDSIEDERVALSKFAVPESVDLTEHQLLEVVSDSGPLGRSTVEITNSRLTSVGRDRRIRFGILPVAGESLKVRVGGCIQWHGYRNRTLYLTQSGGRDIDRVILSDVS